MLDVLDDDDKVSSDPVFQDSYPGRWDSGSVRRSCHCPGVGVRGRSSEVCVRATCRRSSSSSAVGTGTRSTAGCRGPCRPTRYPYDAGALDGRPFCVGVTRGTSRFSGSHWSLGFLFSPVQIPYDLLGSFLDSSASTSCAGLTSVMLPPGPTGLRPKCAHKCLDAGVCAEGSTVRCCGDLTVKV